MAAEHTLAEQKGLTIMHTYIYIHFLTNAPTKCQPSAPYGIQEIAQTRFYRSRSLRQGQRSHHDNAHLHLLTNVPTRYQLATPYCFQDIAWTRF